MYAMWMGVEFENVTFAAEKKDYRPSVVIDDVNGATFENVIFNEPGSEGKQQIIQRVPVQFDLCRQLADHFGKELNIPVSYTDNL